MNIIFSLSTTFNNDNKNFKSNEFTIKADTHSYLPSIFNLKEESLEIKQEFYKDYIKVYDLLKDDKEEIYQYNKDEDFLNHIYKKIEDIINKINSINLNNDKFKESTYKIPLHIFGNQHVWQVFVSTLNKKVTTLSPSEHIEGSHIFHKIPWMEEKVSSKNNKNFIFSFEFNGLISSTFGVHGIIDFDFDSKIKQMNLQIAKLNEINEKIKKSTNIDFHNFSLYSSLEKWLKLSHLNIENFICITYEFLLKIRNNSSDHSKFNQINSLSYIWNSLIYELLQPYSQVGSISNKYFDLKKDSSIFPFIKDFQFFDYTKVQLFEDGKVSGEKINITNEDFKNILNLFKKYRHDTFHINSGKIKEDGIENEYNLNYLTSNLWWSPDNYQNQLIQYILIVKDFILDSYFVIWQIYNSKCGDKILGPADAIKDRHNSIFKDFQ